jgi:tetratricopeptide (TPR) repeat protein
MGTYAEDAARHYQFTREAQDAYATESLTRAKRATADGSFVWTIENERGMYVPADDDVFAMRVVRLDDPDVHALRVGQERAARDRDERAVALDPASRPLRSDLGLAYATLGQILQRTLKLRDAADLHRRAIDIREGLVNENPDNTTYRHNLLVNYGNLADVLASAPWQNLGDTSGAIALLEKAAALAELSRRADPADRGASFDLVNAKYRLGLTMTEDPTRLDAALANYAEAARLTKELRAQDPKRYVYAQFDGLLEWRSGLTLLLLGRSDAAAKRFEAAQTIAADWLGTSGATLRPLYVRSTAALATVRAQAGDVRAGALATDAARELALLPPGPINVDAPAYRSVGAAYLEIARSMPTTRPAMLEEAVRHLEKSAVLLRSFKTPAEAEPRRQRELREVDAELAACQRLSR